MFFRFRILILLSFCFVLFWRVDDLARCCCTVAARLAGFTYGDFVSRRTTLERRLFSLFLCFLLLLVWTQVSLTLALLCRYIVLEVLTYCRDAV